MVVVGFKRNGWSLPAEDPAYLSVIERHVFIARSYRMLPYIDTEAFVPQSSLSARRPRIRALSPIEFTLIFLYRLAVTYCKKKERSLHSRNRLSHSL